MNIRTFQPQLPEATAIEPYLRVIDRNRRYSNAGPLLEEFEGRLATHFGLPAGRVACVANGTTALTLALRALDAKPGTLCMMPAWTFVATAHAALAAGLVPYLSTSTRRAGPCARRRRGISSKARQDRSVP